MNLNNYKVVAKFKAYILEANNWYACSLLQRTNSPTRKTLRKAMEKAEKTNQPQILKNKYLFVIINKVGQVIPL